MKDWEGVHTCHDECPCQHGGKPAPDFLPGEGLSDDDIARIVERQVIPQVLAHELGVETGMVNVAPGADGVEVKCALCGRTGRMPAEVAARIPAGKQAVCPLCIEQLQ